MNDRVGQIIELVKGLPEDGLRIVAGAVADELRQAGRTQAFKQLAHFRLGEEVKFKYRGKKMKGRIIKINQRTASVDVGEEGHWNVSPSLLRKIK